MVVGAEGRFSNGVVQVLYDDAVVRIEKAAELAERRLRMIDLETFPEIINQSQGLHEARYLPCHMLPVTKINRSLVGRMYSSRLSLILSQEMSRLTRSPLQLIAWVVSKNLRLRYSKCTRNWNAWTLFYR